VTKRSNKRKKGDWRVGATEGDSVTAWLDRVWLKVELVLLLHTWWLLLLTTVKRGELLAVGWRMGAFCVVSGDELLAVS
jgi:hypothetical protein